MKYTKEQLKQFEEINQILDRMEKKLDEMLAMMEKPLPKLNIKGYPAKNFDWTSKIFSFKTKGNSE
jgi:hypothetical protein